MNNPNLEHQVWVCVSKHRSEYDNPIKLSKGETVKLGEFSTEENWKDWIWAENVYSQGGWVPIQILEFSEDKSKGIVLEDYSAKELDVDEKEQFIKIKSLNGWSWVKRLNSSDEGWVPDEVIEPGNL
jgi:hypothetical protein